MRWPALRLLALLILVAGCSWAVWAQDLDLPVEQYAPRPKVSPTPVIAPDPPEQEEEKPPTIYGSEMPRSGSVFFVLDISGSMGLDLDSELLDRLGRAKRELTKAIEALPGDWTFNAAAYDCHTTCFAASMVQADGAHKKSASTWVNALTPQGATGTGLAVVTALAMDRSNKLVVLLTDGDPNCNSVHSSGNVPAPEHRADILEGNTQRATINVFGISATGQFAEFCRDVASDNNGVFVSVR